MTFCISVVAGLLHRRLVHRRRGACHAGADGGQVVFNATAMKFGDLTFQNRCVACDHPRSTDYSKNKQFS